MDEITLLSPHRDDAVFSLFVSLSRWRETPVSVTVVNFFTKSVYAPRAVTPAAASVSAVRAQEDRRALTAIDPRIRVTSAGLLDAPLRLNIDSRDVCRPVASACDDSNDLRTLSAIIRDNVRNSLAVAPLGLGNHVDHLLVRNAAIARVPPHALAFYEDLPYATWTSEANLNARVTDCEQRTRTALKPLVVRGERAVWRKRKVGAYYQSQITPSEGIAIARFAARYGGGERIWIPRHGRRWTSFVNRYA